MVRERVLPKTAGGDEQGAQRAQDDGQAAVARHEQRHENDVGGVRGRVGQGEAGRGRDGGNHHADSPQAQPVEREAADGDRQQRGGRGCRPEGADSHGDRPKRSTTMIGLAIDLQREVGYGQAAHQPAERGRLDAASASPS